MTRAAILTLCLCIAGAAVTATSIEQRITRHIANAIADNPPR